MKPLFFLSLLCLFGAGLHAQLTDNFNDGNFTEAPSWAGDTVRFAVINGVLQLNDLNPGSGNISYLYVPAPTSLDAATRWEFFVRLDFSPSTTNFARIYLSASNPDLTGDQNGYYLQIGGISGNEDALELYRQDGSSSTLLIKGTAGAAGGATVVAGIRISRSPEGNWELSADYAGGTSYQTEGQATDLTYDLGRFFGLYCRYSSTRSQSFFFDNILIDPIWEDRTPPRLLEAEPLAADRIKVRFDEPLNAEDSSNPELFQIEPGIGHPAEAFPDAGDPSSVVLQLGVPLTSGVPYTLTIPSIRDQNGNPSGILRDTFIYYDIQPAEAGDILFTEIFPDPAPPLGFLPEAEYVELYNAGNKVIQLADLAFSNGSTPRKLPPFLLLPGRYLILCHQDNEADFTAFGLTAPVSGFPALTNGADEVILTAANGLVIDRVDYRQSWYKDEEKNDGGWSLERIDLQGPSFCGSNWGASESPSGGTPGQPNSLLGRPADNTPPSLISVIAQSPTELVLTFNESLDARTAGMPVHYFIDNGILIREALVQGPENDQVSLDLSTPLRSGELYILTVSNAIKDCLGNAITDANSLPFGLAEPIGEGDLAINEVLFNPQSGGKDFVELYNRSGKVLNLNGMVIRNAQKTSGTIEETIESDFLLFPQSFAVITADPQDILLRYEVKDPAALVANDLPTLDAEAGNVSLMVNGLTIDSFDYSDDFHFALLENTRGVSLERLDPAAPTQQPGNWHSAASTAGFATPTSINSQFFSATAQASGIFDLPQTTFSPDGDGFEDILLIHYQIDRPGFVLNLHIFDAQGRPVRQLIDGELLASEGTFKWDGTNDNREKARFGIYVLWFELFAPGGTVERSKKTCVLAGKL